MKKYDPQEIEQKWQKKWEEDGLYKTPDSATKENKMYILPQLPYPSGSGLHVGHAEVYTACDIYARYQRMNGRKVLQVFGLDSFGLPAENFAIKNNVHPRQTIDEAGSHFVEQVKSLGISVDWDRFVRSSDPEYYKWTQWFFLLMHERGLAYRKKQRVNWCEECKTVLANEQVVDGKCERSDTIIEQKEMEQWYLRITEYADRLLEGLDRIDWPEETKKRQRDWIGKREGAEIQFELSIQGSDAGSSILSEMALTVFTTRPDTIFGATYMVLAPEHEVLEQLREHISNWEQVRKYIKQTGKKTELERQVDQKKTGIVLSGVTAVNPVSGEEIPVWIADYVLASYGTGAIMAVPAHDERDYAFAKKYDLPIREIVLREVGTPIKGAVKRDGVYGIVQKEDRILIQHDTKQEAYRLPGGGVEEGEELTATLYREFQEETGYVSFDIQSYVGSVQSHYACWELCSTPGEGRERIMSAYQVSLSSDDIDENLLGKDDAGRHEYSWMTLDEIRATFKDNPADTGELALIEMFFDSSNRCFLGDGIAYQSGFLTYMTTAKAKESIIKHLEEHKVGKGKTTYKLRDWSVSRQRFWGAPIPMLYDGGGATHPIPTDDLPVLLPNDVDFKPTGQSPLTDSVEFQKGVEEKYGKGWRREVDTLDTFMCSSWYYYRYLDPNNSDAFASPEALKNWMPVDFYLGGEEHVNGHLLYARFFTKVLFDAGYIDFDEPFLTNRHQGLILGEDNRKMSKRWGNAINPTDVIAEFGADTCRMYEMFMGPLEDTKPWSTGGVKGVRRFLDRVWKLQERVENAEASEELTTVLHQTIQKVTLDTQSLQFNTAIAKMMELINALHKHETVPQSVYEALLKLLSPYAPHVAQELWSILGSDGFIEHQPWPSYDSSLAASSSVTIGVQVNGKVRGQIAVTDVDTQDEAFSRAMEIDSIASWVGSKKPRNVIYVPKKILNIVV
jgi:leucyl-tRNA synthetase